MVGMDRFLKKIGRVVDSPYCGMVVGFILVFTSLCEVWGTVWHDVSHFKFGVHHGVIVYGVYTILKSVPDLHEGLRHFNREKA